MVDGEEERVRLPDRKRKVAVPGTSLRTMANKDPPTSAEEKARYDKVKDELAKMLMKKRAADRQLVCLAFDPRPPSTDATRLTLNCPSTTSRQATSQTLRRPETSYTALTATLNPPKAQLHDGNTR